MPDRARVRPAVVVPGAGAGAARAISLYLARRGWRVALILRSHERLADAARDKIVAAWGGVDAWLNAAMVTVVSPVSHMTAAEYRRRVMEAS